MIDNLRAEFEVQHWCNICVECWERSNARKVASLVADAARLVIDRQFASHNLLQQNVRGLDGKKIRLAEAMALMRILERYGIIHKVPPGDTRYEVDFNPSEMPKVVAAIWREVPDAESEE